MSAEVSNEMLVMPTPAAFNTDATEVLKSAVSAVRGAFGVVLQLVPVFQSPPVAPVQVTTAACAEPAIKEAAMTAAMAKLRPRERRARLAIS